MSKYGLLLPRYSVSPNGMPAPHWLILAAANPRLDSVLVRVTMAWPVTLRLSEMSKWPFANPESRSSGVDVQL